MRPRTGFAAPLQHFDAQAANRYHHFRSRTEAYRRIAASEVQMMSEEENRFALALGRAVIGAWGKLPQDIQHRLFEDAVVAGHHDERDESLREQLAAFLHGRHPRTR